MKKEYEKMTIMGLSIPMYACLACIILFAAIKEILPANMVGALAVMVVFGSLFHLFGSKIPIIRSYLGGGAVFCIFASSALSSFGLLPESVVGNCKAFMNEVGFLDFYISALITGSILGMDRNLLKKATARFLPVSFLSMACAMLMGGAAGMVSGYGFRESILYIAMPMMSGGMGAGVTPLSEIYAQATGLEQASILSRMIPASAVGNVLAIISAALLAKLGTRFPEINGNGKLMDLPMEEIKAESSKQAALDVSSFGTGLLFSMAFFTTGTLLGTWISNVHAYACMIILVVAVKILGWIPEKYEQMAVQWGQFVMKNFTNALLAGIGIALLDIKELGNALTPQFLFICIVIILTVSAASAVLGKLCGFYPIEASITAGLCTNSMGGTGNIAVLSAADRMELIPFAQIATRLGGAMVLIVSSGLIRVLG